MRAPRSLVECRLHDGATIRFPRGDDACRRNCRGSCWHGRANPARRSASTSARSRKCIRSTRCRPVPRPTTTDGVRSRPTVDTRTTPSHCAAASRWAAGHTPRRATCRHDGGRLGMPQPLVVGQHQRRHQHACRLAVASCDSPDEPGVRIGPEDHERGRRRSGNPKAAAPGLSATWRRHDTHHARRRIGDHAGRFRYAAARFRSETRINRFPD